MAVLLLTALLACQGDKGSPTPVDDTESSPPGEEIVPRASACGPLSTAAGAPVLAFGGGAPRNLLFITVDTLRRDRLGRYDPASSTPFLDGFLSEAVVLDDTRSCANWTYPGMVCTMTGQSTLDLGLEPVIPGEAVEEGLLPDDAETLATWLTAAGWQTALVTASHLFSDANSIANGFQAYETDDDEPADWVVEVGLSQLRTFDPERPWYLHLHFRDPHAPYAPPEAWQGVLAGVDLGGRDPRTETGVIRIRNESPQFDAETLGKVRRNIDILYRGEVSYLDSELARLWDTLEAEGALDDTLVVLTADHGEQNFEHMGFQHAQSLHAEEGMIPGAFWAKDLAPVVWEGPVSQPDFAPTILDALGVDIPPSVTGGIVGTWPDDRLRLSTARASDDRPVQAVERNGWRLMYHWTGEKRLYDAYADPAETEDLYTSVEPEIVENISCLWDFLRPAIAQVDAARAGGEPVAPE